MPRNAFYLLLIALVPLLISCEKQQAEVIVVNTLEEEDTTTQVIENTKIEQPEWAKNAVIYEVNVRQYSEAGSFEAVTEDLERLKDLGVDVIWLMPIHPIGQKNRKGTLGSYYAVKDYKAVNPEFGNLDDFKALVDKAHQMDMKVIIDWVANHSSPDNVWIKEHLDYYTKDSLGNAPIPTIGTDWLDVADLNYDNPDLRKAMQDAMMYWVTETNIDGFRCDVAEMVPLDFWKDTRKKLDSIKPMFMLAEGAAPELHEAFNMTYGWPLKDVMLEIADKTANFSKIFQYTEKRNQDFAPEDLIMYFTTNHDENSWNYIEQDVFGLNLKNYTALTYVLGGMPLIYSGQEAKFDKQLEFFEKDPIQWGDYQYADYFKQLISVYKKNPALWNNGERPQYEVLRAENNGLHFIIKKNDDLVAVLQNYSKHEQYVSQISLNGFDLKTNLIDNSENNVSERGLKIPAHTTIIIGQSE